MNGIFNRADDTAGERFAKFFLRHLIMAVVIIIVILIMMWLRH